METTIDCMNNTIKVGDRVLFSTSSGFGQLFKKRIVEEIKDIDYGYQLRRMVKIRVPGGNSGWTFPSRILKYDW